jgi:hypothetical protein
MRKWVSFETLNEVFDIESKRKGAWINTDNDEKCDAPWNKGMKGKQVAHNRSECVWKGKKYKSQMAAAKANGVSSSTMSRWLKEQCVPNGPRGASNRIPVTYKGKKYKSKTECIKKEKIGRLTLEAYLNN